MAMKVSLLRIDDRYIHGQITVKWLSRYKSDMIWVVDDKLAKNPFLKQIQLATAPENTQTEVLTVDESLEKWDPKGDRLVFIIVSNPRDALTLIENDVEMNTLNIGNMGYKEGKIMVTETVSLGSDDLDAVRKILDKGIKIFYQQVPELGRPIDFEEKLREKNIR